MYNGTPASEKRVRRSCTSKWVYNSAWFTTGIYFLVSAVISSVWILLFQYAFNTWFTSLWPISDYFWRVLIFVISALMVAIIRHRTHIDLTRDLLTAEFVAQITGMPSAVAMFEAYRLRHDAEFNNNKTPLQLRMNYLKSRMLDANARPVALCTALWVCVWLYVASAPFLAYGYYDLFGFFVVLFINWPLLAVAHSMTALIDPYASISKDARVAVDYDALLS